MRKRKTYYELSRSQVNTPLHVVKTFWRIVGQYRTSLTSVVDLGAGDGRFALGGRYKKYLGIEIDGTRTAASNLPKHATLINECAFRNVNVGFSACIGNPPYVRHHDLEQDWRDRIADQLTKATGVAINRKCNLYVYFLFLGLLKTNKRGIVASVIPYEWLSRPSAKPLRDYIIENRWQVDAYRFQSPIFAEVATTTSICVIDKRLTNGRWRYFSVDDEGVIHTRAQVTGSTEQMIKYEKRGPIWAMRGMSPGTQEVFTLTEGERIHAGLLQSDVYPCVTSLRYFPQNIANLTATTFRKRFVEGGEKCWLIKSDQARISKRLLQYLECVPELRRDTTTCNLRDCWFKYKLAKVPDILVSSGFVGESTKSVINSVQAHAVGGVHGVYDVPSGYARELQRFLASAKIADRLVAHSGRLRKLEVKQLNAILIEFIEQKL